MTLNYAWTLPGLVQPARGLIIAFESKNGASFAKIPWQEKPFRYKMKAAQGGGKIT